MSQHDYDIADQTAPNVRSDLNLALKALASTSSGATAPATTYANMLWYHTTDNLLKKRNEANNGWITLGTLNDTTSTFTPTLGENLVDEDDMASNSAVKVPSQQSVKAYVDAKSITQTGGSAPYFGARAWVNFYWNGSAVVIRGSGNVSGVIRNGVGDYTITFTTALGSSNYVVIGSYSVNSPASASNNDGQVVPQEMYSASCGVQLTNGGAGVVDPFYVCNLIMIA